MSRARRSSVAALLPSLVLAGGSVRASGTDPAGAASFAAARVLGFTAVQGKVTGSPSEICASETTRRAYWVDPDGPAQTPHEIGARLIGEGAATTHLNGWALDGRAILTVGRFKDPAIGCAAGEPYPFVYESCLCTLDPTDPCDCLTRRVDWPGPRPSMTGVHQVKADPGHYYFGVTNAESLAQLFRMDLDGCLKTMAGAAGHGGVASPTERNVYALEGVPQGSLRRCGNALPPSNNTCLIIRRGQEPTYFTDCQGPAKSVYANWSPDGTRLVFARGADDPYRLAVARWSATCSDITVLELANAPPLCASILHNSSMTAWDGDGRWLYYSTCSAPGQGVEIVRVEIRADGTAGLVEDLTNGHPQLQGRSFKAYAAPWGHELAFTAGSPGSWQLFVRDLRQPSGVLREMIDPLFLKPDSFVAYPSWRPAP